jgi:membrane peptidoglycan carboxypeptidase
MKRKAMFISISLLIFFFLNFSIIFFTAYFRTLPDPIFPKVASKTTVSGSLIEFEKPQTTQMVEYSEISPNFIKAIVAIEDHRFYKHSGIDLIGIVRAFFSNVKSGDIVKSGGSTITQQFARNAYTFLGQQKLFSRKIAEAAIAIRLEQMYSKEKILESYCNIIYVGHGLYGVESAANYYFGKTAKELTLNESATIAGLLKSPGYYSPYVSLETAIKNRNVVLDRMAELGYISEEVADAESEKGINLVR